MKGDKGGLARGDWLFQRISQGEKFRQSIEDNMADFKKEIEGFSYSPYKHFLGTLEKTEEFKKRIDIILQKNALPINSWWQRKVMVHILSKDGKDFMPPLWKYQMPFIEIINHHVGKDGSYNDIRLYEGATQNDLKDFMLKNWTQAKPSYREGTSQRIRKQANMDVEINKRALELSKLSKKELGPFTKDVAIAKRLSEEFDRKIYSDEVKARLRRTKGKQR